MFRALSNDSSELGCVVESVAGKLTKSLMESRSSIIGRLLSEGQVNQ